jgi:hypothetical protein
MIAGVMTVAMILPLIVSPPHGHKAAKESPVGARAVAR